MLKLNNNNFYYISLFTAILFYSFISYENISFDLYFNYLYEDYANFFRSYDKNELRYENTTFPLWGYGFLHLIGKNKLIFLIIQQLLTFGVLIYIDKVIRKYMIIRKIELFRIFILLSSSWFFFHTQMWPKSIAANLLILGLILIVDYLNSKERMSLILSGIVFGLLHNFRSDYIYLSIVIFVFLVISEKINYRILITKFYFPFIQIIFLVPWMAFTFNQIDKPLISSTNSGHVLFIGLGQLPDNKWGITPYDEDPVKLRILSNEFDKDYSNIDYAEWNGIEENEFLKKEFFKRIKENPREWIRKCFYSLRLLVLDPFYVGNVGNFQENKISNINEIRSLEKLIYNFKINEAFELIRYTEWSFSLKEIFQLIITIFTKIFGIILFLISSLLITLSYIRITSKEFYIDKIDLFLTICVIYQISISIFAFHMPVYNSAQYLIYLLLSYRLFQKYLSIKQ